MLTQSLPLHSRLTQAMTSTVLCALARLGGECGGQRFVVYKQAWCFDLAHMWGVSAGIVLLSIWEITQAAWHSSADTNDWPGLGEECRGQSETGPWETCEF